MENSLSSSFLGNVQRRIAKQMEKSDFHSIFYNTTVTANLFQNFRSVSRNLFLIWNKVLSLNFDMENPFLGNIQWKIVIQ